jgi:integrase/recombinase XerD
MTGSRARHESMEWRSMTAISLTPPQMICFMLPQQTLGIDMARIRLRHVTIDRDRNGNTRYYFRVAGKPKIRLPGLPGSTEFLAAYQAAVAGDAKPGAHVSRSPATGSFAELCIAYYSSPEWTALDVATKAWRTRALDRIASDRPRALVKDLDTVRVRKLRNELVETPGAANNRLKALKALFSWAVENDHADHNPARDVKLIRYKTTGHHSWTAAEMTRFVERHPVGSKAYLAFVILTFTAGRREDAVRLSPSNVSGNRVKFTQAKNEHRNPVVIDIPLHPVLAAAIADTSPDAPAFLLTEWGKPFTASGFGGWFAGRCDEAGVPGRAHGLRKATATSLAEAGASAHEIMAITGHRTLDEVERYTKAARQSRLADNAFAKLALSHSISP